MNSVVGMMFCRNEGDILEEILENCLHKVDSWFIADDGSTDSSWVIIQSFKSKYPDKIEYARNKREDPKDTGQRQALLDEIRRRYKPENTWVQILDADMMIFETDVRKAIESYASLDIGVAWCMLNAAREPGTWKGVDTFPDWKDSVTDIMPFGHKVEYLLYTFRPLPLLKYNLDVWRPWPQGFSQYVNDFDLIRHSTKENTPLLAHYGYRGPTHFYRKNKNKKFNKYPSWDCTSPELVEKTVYFFQWGME